MVGRRRCWAAVCVVVIALGALAVGISVLSAAAAATSAPLLSAAFALQRRRIRARASLYLFGGPHCSGGCVALAQAFAFGRIWIERSDESAPKDWPWTSERAKRAPPPPAPTNLRAPFGRLTVASAAIASATARMRPAPPHQQPVVAFAGSHYGISEPYRSVQVRRAGSSRRRRGRRRLTCAPLTLLPLSLSLSLSFALFRVFPAPKTSARLRPRGSIDLQPIDRAIPSSLAGRRKPMSTAADRSELDNNDDNDSDHELRAGRLLVARCHVNMSDATQISGSSSS